MPSRKNKRVFNQAAPRIRRIQGRLRTLRRCRRSGRLEDRHIAFAHFIRHNRQKQGNHKLKRSREIAQPLITFSRRSSDTPIEAPSPVTINDPDYKAIDPLRVSALMEAVLRQTRTLIG